jgi:type II secretory ATPase GspE/PulE/Tfp pilus assembly ATPase PilB-like protein
MLTAIYGSMADIADPVYNPSTYQDARIGKAKYLPKTLHGIRIACGPQVGGTLMVMRLLYADTKNSGGSVAERLHRLGYTDDHGHTVNFMRSRPTGINVVSGPTGSGKSTTLKHILESVHIERPDLNILSVEDPPEYPIEGVAQLPVTNADTDEERKAAFGAAIRAALRMDPDIILIGEIRDAESAKLAIRAAMTGHQVWTTLHANSGFNIFNRLADILSDGGEGNPLAILSDITVTTGLVFQRLAKVLCDHCKKPLVGNESRVDAHLLKRIDRALETREGVCIKGDGCTDCMGTGVSGRTVLAEVIATDPEMLKILKDEGIDEARRYWLDKQSGQTALAHGLEKISQGIVDPAQAEEVVGLLTTDLVFGDNTIFKGELNDI